MYKLRYVNTVNQVSNLVCGMLYRWCQGSSRLYPHHSQELMHTGLNDLDASLPDFTPSGPKMYLPKATDCFSATGHHTISSQNVGSGEKHADKGVVAFSRLRNYQFFGEILSTVVQKLLGGNCSVLHILYNFSWAIQRYIERLDRIRRNNLWQLHNMTVYRGPIVVGSTEAARVPTTLACRG